MMEENHPTDSSAEAIPEGGGYKSENSGSDVWAALILILITTATMIFYTAGA